ncbi:MAG: T9SS type A sorting domain-containing protein [Flavobacterium sp.]|uniref:DUF7619 domain-containing protein n=1 Tax=Flavobacterium sp. TaxID=239 RepID=UPI003264A057
MKKLYTLLTFAFIVFVGNAQIVNIPDANFKTRLLSLSVADASGNYIYDVDTNNDGEIQVSEAQAVTNLSVSNGSISDLTGIEAFTNLTILGCYTNLITTLDVSMMPNLYNLNCSYNHLTSLNLGPLPYLYSLNCNNNQLQLLNIGSLPYLSTLDCSVNQLTTLDLSNTHDLTLLNCYFNQITSLDLSGLRYLYNLTCYYNPLIDLNIKNGNNETTLNFSNCPSLQYVCSDDAQIATVQTKIDQYGYTNCHVNTYCSFTPGGAFYTIQGNSKYDINGNGYDGTDLDVPNLKLSFTDGTHTGTIIPDSDGNYSYDVQAGSHTLTPVLENPTYFGVTPLSFTANFPTNPSPVTRNFSITATNLHQDVETWIIPLTSARPGFDSRYKIKFKNKGNVTVSGHLNFSFDDDYMDFISATPIPNSQNFSLLSWDYTALIPFETREINITFNLNTPLESLPLNTGDLIKFESTVYPLTGDELMTDNSNHLRQLVINSHDPNDKTCVEGTTIEPEMVGEYVHYVIRFENTGTANAENIVVKDMIDTTKYDIATLIPLSGSANFVTNIRNTNQVEFIFENINLPFEDTNNDGYVAFKIKTKPTLVLGDTFSNTANIYFDYNAPVITNTYTTTVAVLGTADFEFSSVFSLSPVPAKSFLNITTKQVITISSISIYNTLGQLVQVITNPNKTIDVSGLKTGSYFIKIISDKGTAGTKFVKE